MTRNDVYSKLAQASLFGNLGLFVGSGFSKSIFLNSFFGCPLSWVELLEKICEINRINWNSIVKEYRSCPEIASTICQRIAQGEGITLKEAEKKAKEQVCNLTSWYPNQQQRTTYTPILTKLGPKWIITTNYDLILEGLLPDSASSLGPNDSLVFSNYNVPVYHLHGIRTSANSLVLTNDDYIKLFRPNEYRLQKLSLTINESTTLIMGYGIGDPNVLTALDWSRNVYQNSKTHYPNGVIQLVYTETPSQDPTETSDGMILLETNSLLDTMSQVCAVVDEMRQQQQNSSAEVELVRNHLINADDTIILQFITEQENRRVYLARISLNYRYVIEPFLSFLSKVFDRCWERVAPNGAFGAYEEMTSIVLDVITEIPYETMPPALFETIASNLDRFSSYIGPGYGQSHAAGRTWNRRKNEIPDVMKAELRNYADQYYSNRIRNLLE